MGWPELDLDERLRRRKEIPVGFPMYLTIAAGERAWRALLTDLPPSWSVVLNLVEEEMLASR